MPEDQASECIEEKVVYDVFSAPITAMHDYLGPLEAVQARSVL